MRLNIRTLTEMPLVLLPIFIVLCAGAPQGYYPSAAYYGYPYRRVNYAAQQRLPIATNRQNSYYGRALSNPSASAVATASSSQTQQADRPNVSKADAENAKFAGASNQEAADESSKTLLKWKKKKRNRCSFFGRDANGAALDEQGRFLWDVNIYNVYPNVQHSSVNYGCGGGGGGVLSGLAALAGLGGLGGGGLGGGLLSDPVAQGYPAPYAGTPFTNFLNLFAPGILQNSLAVTARPPPLFQPQLQGDPGGGVNNLQSDPAVSPSYNPPLAPLPPIRRPPNQIYFDSAGSAPITPAQLIGGVATTVNGIIQQLTGNVQPVYPSG